MSRALAPRVDPEQEMSCDKLVGLDLSAREATTDALTGTTHTAARMQADGWGLTGLAVRASGTRADVTYCLERK